MKISSLFISALTLAVSFYFCGCATNGFKNYSGQPYQDSVYQGGAQKIPGKVQCAYYDFGGEGVAHHVSGTTNFGSGRLNPADGTYLNEFRMQEAVSTSYTKFHRQMPIDDNPFDLVTPPANQLYVGWTEPGEWFNLTVDVQQAGTYTVDLLYTSNRGGTISLARNGRVFAPDIQIISTSDKKEPIAWRQWHHWNVMTNIAEVKLPKGKSVLTVRIVSQGNMNLAWLEFKPKGR
ncbi:MAG TPA: hypothetical protein VK811_08930 [Candidatus Acidoferrum sp.]|jgi:hypothetical protein|nr:hypothetical protein [Candidatus Acidoferrum sp.]